VTDVRDDEVGGLRFIGLVKSLNQSISLVGPALVSFVTFLTMIGLGQELTASVAFTVLSLYNVARYPLSSMPLSIKAYAGTEPDDLFFQFFPLEYDLLIFLSQSQISPLEDCTLFLSSQFRLTTARLSLKRLRSL
jgi:hypothetical protein